MLPIKKPASAERSLGDSVSALIHPGKDVSSAEDGHPNPDRFGLGEEDEFLSHPHLVPLADIVNDLLDRMGDVFGMRGAAPRDTISVMNGHPEELHSPDDFRKNPLPELKAKGSAHLLFRPAVCATALEPPHQIQKH